MGINKSYSYRACAMLIIALVACTLLLPFRVHAQEKDFSLQISPSPIVETVAPGQTKDIELKIRNNGSSTEKLKIESRAFKYDNDTEEISLHDTEGPEIASWISYQSPNFTVQPGEWFTQRIRIAVPAQAGFSYSLAFVISRQDQAKPNIGARGLEGSVAVFALINIDRPDAVRKLDIATFTSKKRVYEYLPAEFSLRFKNEGNTIVQPYGNIFIQRSSSDEEPISTLPVNESKGHILPDTLRTYKATWDKGFPVYTTAQSAANTAPERKLTWDWSELDNFRIGRYTAKLVAVYNDGQRDVPLVTELTFWVIPWRILAVMGIFVLLVLLGAWTMVRRLLRLRYRTKRSHTHHDDSNNQ